MNIALLRLLFDYFDHYSSRIWCLGLTKTILIYNGLDCGLPPIRAILFCVNPKIQEVAIETINIAKIQCVKFRTFMFVVAIGFVQLI